MGMSTMDDQPNDFPHAQTRLSKDRKKAVALQEYAIEFLTMGLLHADFCDAVKESDGKRVLRCWKFFLLYFKASK